MPKTADTITFELRPLKTGWHIVVTYPGGLQEYIPGFHDAAEAKEWLSGKRRQTWLRARGYGNVEETAPRFREWGLSY